MLERDAHLIWTWEPRYDTYYISKDEKTDRLTFFQVPLGAFGSGFARLGEPKTSSETNLYMAGRVGQLNQFILYGFAASVPRSTGKEDKDAISQGVFTFYLGGDNKLFESPMGLIPINPSEKNEFLDNKGKLKDNRIRKLPYKTELYYLTPDKNPLLFRRDQSFRIEISYPNGPLALPSGQDCRLTIFMVGLYGQAI